MDGSTGSVWTDERGFRHRRVDAGAATLHCAAAGHPDAPPVVCLHGFPECWYAWRHLLDPLAEAGFRAVAPDLRGYGLSDRPRGVAPYRLDRLATDVVGLVERLGGRAHLVGHDWGGVVALVAAATRPDAVGRLVVANAPFPGGLRAQFTLVQALRSWYVAAFQVPALPEAALAADDYALLARLLRDGPRVPDAVTPADLRVYRDAWRRPGAVGAMVNYYRAFARALAASPVRGVPWPADRPVRVPALVLWGERDAALGPRTRRHLASRLPDGRVERLPDASHWLHLEHPDRVAHAVRTFLTE